LTEFERERVFAERHRLYGREFQMHAMTARGAAFMRCDRIDDAIACFREALTLYPDNAPVNLGLADALRSTGQEAAADACRVAAETALSTLEQTRPIYAAMVKAELAVARGDVEAGGRVLMAALRNAPPGFACWTIPIEPGFRKVVGLPAFAPFLKELADRAR
jgi:hypothetical protein